jgi:hypothetical protein
MQTEVFSSGERELQQRRGRSRCTVPLARAAPRKQARRSEVLKAAHALDLICLDSASPVDVLGKCPVHPRTVSPPADHEIAQDQDQVLAFR